MATLPDEDGDLSDAPNHLAAWCKRKDVSYAELGRRIGRSRSQITRLANSERGLSVYYLRRIAAALEIPAEALLYDPYDPSPAARLARASIGMKARLLDNLRDELGE